MITSHRSESPRVCGDEISIKKGLEIDTDFNIAKRGCAITKMEVREKPLEQITARCIQAVEISMSRFDSRCNNTILDCPAEIASVMHGHENFFKHKYDILREQHIKTTVIILQNFFSRLLLLFEIRNLISRYT
jgi:hypothetical protein